MTNFKRFLTFLYAAISLRFLLRTFVYAKRTPPPEGLERQAKVVAFFVALFWPITYPWSLWMNYSAKRQLFRLIEQEIAQEEAWDLWPNDWDDDLTPEQEDYWNSLQDEEDAPIPEEDLNDFARWFLGADLSDDEPVILLLTYTPSESEVYDWAKEDEKNPLFTGFTILGGDK